jgi:hypothetical protein
MSRPKFVPTDAHRTKVRSLAAYGTKHDDIAKVIGLRSAKTLRKHYREELTRGSIEATAQVGQTLYQMATSGEQPACTIFWMKVRGGWRESRTPRPHPPQFLILSS